MKIRKEIGVVFFIVATALVVSWLSVWSFSNFKALNSDGLPAEDLEVIPAFIRSFYTGFPSFIVLVSYVLYAMVSFLTIKEKQKVFRFLGIISFVFLILILKFLL